jgi:cytochrome c oxidase subunit II
MTPTAPPAVRFAGSITRALRPTISPRRLGGLATTAAVGASLLVTAPASAGLLGPEAGGSPNADRIQTLYWLIFAMALVVFAVVGGALIYAVVKFKAGPGKVARQIHGNTKFEIGCTIGAAAILVFLTVVTFIMLPGIKNPDATGDDGLALASGGGSGSLYASTDQPDPPGGKGMKIVVDGQQYAWRYQYPSLDGGRSEGVYSLYEMVVPSNTTVLLDITADDVNHSWWIPKLGGKFDAIPGYTNKTWFKAKEGTYKGQCAELCGRNHADMKAEVRVVSPDEYEQWYEDQKQALQDAADERDAAAPRYEGQ